MQQHHKSNPRVPLCSSRPQNKRLYSHPVPRARACVVVRVVHTLMVQNKSLSEYTDDAPAPPPAPPCLLSYTDAPPPPPPPPPAAPPLLLAPAPTLDGSLESGGPPVVYPNADMSLVMMLMATLTTPVDVTRVTATVKPGQKSKR